MTNTGKSIDLIATQEIAAALAWRFLLARIRNRLAEEERIPVRGIEVEFGEHIDPWNAA